MFCFFKGGNFQRLSVYFFRILLVVSFFNLRQSILVLPFPTKQPNVMVEFLCYLWRRKTEPLLHCGGTVEPPQSNINVSASNLKTVVPSIPVVSISISSIQLAVPFLSCVADYIERASLLLMVTKIFKPYRPGYQFQLHKICAWGLHQP